MVLDFFTKRDDHCLGRRFASQKLTIIITVILTETGAAGVGYQIGLGIGCRTARASEVEFRIKAFGTSVLTPDLRVGNRLSDVGNRLSNRLGLVGKV